MASTGCCPRSAGSASSSWSTSSCQSTPRAAAAGDDLASTVDYSTLAHLLAEVIGGEPVALIETLAQRLADVCLGDPMVEAVEVTVHKPDAPVGLPVSDVMVTITRGRRE